MNPGTYFIGFAPRSGAIIIIMIIIIIIIIFVEVAKSLPHCFAIFVSVV